MTEVTLGERPIASLERHEDWLRARNRVAAQRFRLDVERSIDLLRAFPEAGQVIEDDIRRLITTRYRYRRVYRIVAGRVLVLDVLHASQA